MEALTFQIQLASSRQAAQPTNHTIHLTAHTFESVTTDFMILRASVICW